MADLDPKTTTPALPERLAPNPFAVPNRKTFLAQLAASVAAGGAFPPATPPERIADSSIKIAEAILKGVGL